MRTKMFYRWTWVILILVTLSLGCKLVNGISKAVAVATQVDLEGLATEVDLRSLPTKIDLEGLATQVGGLATEIDQGAFETANAAMETQMKAMSTELGLGDLMTQMPALQGTMESFSTPPGFPSDIPLLEGERSLMGGSATDIQYTVKAKLPDAVDFYRREMSARGWSEANESHVEDKVANLIFQRGDQTVTVSMVEDLFFGLIVSIAVGG
jgi:hypothetical protein